jgi:hypothetical protein
MRNCFQEIVTVVALCLEPLHFNIPITFSSILSLVYFSVFRIVINSYTINHEYECTVAYWEFAKKSCLLYS